MSASDAVSRRRGADSRWRFFLRLRFILRIVCVLFIVRALLTVFGNFQDYFPPNFNSDFLLGREGYFFGIYRWAFYLHIVTGPLSLVLGVLLVSQRFLKRFPNWHRRLGRVQAICVLGGVCPSGLMMSFWTQAGALAAVGFASLSVATGASIGFGWMYAVQRKFRLHQQWMWRCFLLLNSAVVLRVIGGLAFVLRMESDAPYIFAAWFSWLGPLAVFELGRMFRTARLRERGFVRMFWSNTGRRSGGS